MRAALAATVAACFACAAQAMQESDRQLIELKNLDLHPRPSWRPEERGTYVYGLVDGVAGRKARTGFYSGFTRDSFIGVAGRETLDGGTEAYARVEQSLVAPEHQPLTRADRELLFGWGRRTTGWAEVGRAGDVASEVASLADPAQGSTLRSAALRALTRPHASHDQEEPAPYSLSARTSDLSHWGVKLQAEVRNGPVPMGASARWEGGTWQLATALRRERAGDWSLPVAGRWILGDSTITGGLGFGREGGASFRGWSLGWRLREPAGAHPVTLDASISGARTEGRSRVAGYLLEISWRLSRATSVHAGAAATSESDQSTRADFRAGIRHRFSL